MVPVLYVIATGLALWGVVVIISGDLVAMLDIATGLFGSAAVVAGLGAVAGALNRISRTINRITVEAGDVQEPVAMTAAPVPAHPHTSFPDTDPDRQGRRDQRREGRGRKRLREAVEAALPPSPEPAPPAPPPVTEERLGSGARAWVERRDLPEHYAPRRRAQEPARVAPEPERDSEQDEESAPAEPHVVRSGTLNGILYRFFSDGSVEAVTPGGPRRFRSMEELREVIVAARNSGARPGMEFSASPEDRPAPLAEAQEKPEPAVEAEAPVAPAPEPEMPPAPEPAAEEELTPEKRLEQFQQNIWATTLAELRRPLDAARKSRSDDER